MSTFTQKKIAIFGDSHEQGLQLPEIVSVLGRGGERARNWHSYTTELRGYGIMIPMISGNDICPRDIFTPADMTLRDSTPEIREFYNYCQQHNSVVLTADMVRDTEGIWKMNNRLLNKFKKNIEFAEVVGNDFSDGVHLRSYEFLSKYLMMKIKLLTESWIKILFAWNLVTDLHVVAD